MASQVRASLRQRRTLHLDLQVRATVQHEHAARHAAQVARAERAHQRARALAAARRGARARRGRGAAGLVAARPWLRACRRAGRRRQACRAAPARRRPRAPVPAAATSSAPWPGAAQGCPLCARLPSPRGQPHPALAPALRVRLHPSGHRQDMMWLRVGVKGRCRGARARAGLLPRDGRATAPLHRPRRPAARQACQALAGPAPGSGRAWPRSTAAPGASRSRPAGAGKKRRASSSGRLPQRRRACAWAGGAYGRADRQPVQASAESALQRAGRQAARGLRAGRNRTCLVVTPRTRRRAALRRPDTCYNRMAQPHCIIAGGACSRTTCLASRHAWLGSGQGGAAGPGPHQR